jgi:hypothetical protein
MLRASGHSPADANATTYFRAVCENPLFDDVDVQTIQLRRRVVLGITQESGSSPPRRDYGRWR